MSKNKTGEKNKYYKNINYGGIKNVYLIGYWQSSRYFDKIKDQILDDLLSTINQLEILSAEINNFKTLHGYVLSKSTESSRIGRKVFVVGKLVVTMASFLPGHSRR